MQDVLLYFLVSVLFLFSFFEDFEHFVAFLGKWAQVPPEAPKGSKSQACAPHLGPFWRHFCLILDAFLEALFDRFWEPFLAFFGVEI